MYGECIVRNLDGIRKDVCAKEMEALRTCARTFVSGRVRVRGRAIAGFADG